MFWLSASIFFLFATITLKQYGTLIPHVPTAYLGQAISLFCLLPILPRLVIPWEAWPALLLTAVFVGLESFTVDIFGAFLSGFYALGVLHVILFYSVMQQYEDFTWRMLRWSVFICRITVVATLAFFPLSPSMPYTGFLDDKSHLTVFTSGILFIEYVNRRYSNKGSAFWCVVFSILTFALQCLTISRLIGLFAPFYIFIILRGLKYGGFWGRSVFATCCAAILVVAGIYWEILQEGISKYNRFAALLQGGDNASSAHTLLLEIGIRQKFQDIWLFIFGGGAGNFHLISSRDPDYNLLIATDPALSGGATSLTGFLHTPAHSVWISSLVEFPLFIWFPCVLYAVILVSKFIVWREWGVVIYCAGLIGSIMFYSEHNNVLFYAIIIWIVAAAEIVRSVSASNREIVASKLSHYTA